jgi:hypothetical protein
MCALLLNISKDFDHIHVPNPLKIQVYELIGILGCQMHLDLTKAANKASQEKSIVEEYLERLCQDRQEPKYIIGTIEFIENQIVNLPPDNLTRIILAAYCNYTESKNSTNETCSKDLGDAVHLLATFMGAKVKPRFSHLIHITANLAFGLSKNCDSRYLFEVTAALQHCSMLPKIKGFFEEQFPTRIVNFPLRLSGNYFDDILNSGIEENPAPYDTLQPRFQTLANLPKDMMVLVLYFDKENAELMVSLAYRPTGESKKIAADEDIKYEFCKVGDFTRDNYDLLANCLSGIDFLKKYKSSESKEVSAVKSVPASTNKKEASRADAVSESFAQMAVLVNEGLNPYLVHGAIRTALPALENIFFEFSNIF